MMVEIFPLFLKSKRIGSSILKSYNENVRYTEGRKYTMKDYKQRILECIEGLEAIRFPCEDWEKDKVFFDKLE